MRRTIIIFFLSIMLLNGLVYAVEPQQLPLAAKNTVCPVMPGTRVREKFHVDYKGKRIFLCCRDCVKAFKKHPEKYLKNLDR